ncbi:MAG: SIR2 family protein [Candidatus Dadabacteria bacterium]|nr:SIR2 family protein [Candidatus Dadabacteria bacterium]
MPDEIIQAAKIGDFVLFVGAGISRLLGLPLWKDMAQKQLEQLVQEGILNYSEFNQLSSLDPKKQISIAHQLAKDNQVKLDPTVGLTEHSEADNIYKSINDIGCVCVTTNYDTLLNPRYANTKDGSKKTEKDNRYFRDRDFRAKHLNNPGTVVHLHGCVREPKTMILTTQRYLKHYDNDYVKDFLGELFEKKTVLFIGYGLEEAEILEHMLRRGGVSGSKERKRFVLQGYYLSQKPLYENLYKYYKQSFGVHVLGFIRDYRDYKQQEQIIRDWGPSIIVKQSSLVKDIDRIREVLGSG